MGAIGRDPIFIARGEGAELLDVDGNSYVDYVCSWGPLIHGHAHPRVLEAIARGRGAGRASARRPRGEVELAARGRAAGAGRRDAADDLLGHRGDDDGAAPRARGRPARACVKFAGAYHGHFDGLLAQAGFGPGHAGAPRQPGRAGGGRGRRPWSCPGTTPTRCAPRPSATSRRRSSPSRCRPTWASCRRADGLPRAAARARRRQRGAADPRRGHQRLPRRARRRAGAQRRARRPDVLGKVIGGGLPAARGRRAAPS